MAADVKAVCPGLFYLLEDTCLQAWREYKRRCLHNEHILIDYNMRSFESGELLPPPRGVLAEQMHLTSMQIVADIMDQYCRSFPEIPANMQVYLQRGTHDADLSEAAKYVLELFVEMLDSMIRFQQNLDDMIDFALCSRENQPRENPSDLLLSMQDIGYEPYTLNAKHLDHIHSKITRYTNHPTSKRKSTMVTATSYASDDISVLIFLTFEQMCLQNMLIKHCHNGGGLFVPYSNTAKYCQRILDSNTGGTCKELVSRKNYEVSVQNDEAKNMIRKRKNTFRMQRTRINPASHTIMQPYYDYLELANAVLKEYQAGQISFEELEVRTRLPE